VAVTTTFMAIRRQQLAVIEALTPTLEAQHRFRRKPSRQPLKIWASIGPTTACYRKFEITRQDASPDPTILDPSAREQNERSTISVAYPVGVQGLYGVDEQIDLDDVMRSDAHQIRDAVFSTANYLAGQSAAFVTILSPDKGLAAVWFQDFEVECIYTEAMSL
jgi:hypothetical protein